MAGMLPGVECARRRRTHHHHHTAVAAPEYPSAARSSPFDRTGLLDENTLRARKNLEEKLRNQLGSSSPRKKWLRIFSKKEYSRPVIVSSATVLVPEYSISRPASGTAPSISGEPRTLPNSVIDVAERSKQQLQLIQMSGLSGAGSALKKRVVVVVDHDQSEREVCSICLEGLDLDVDLDQDPNKNNNDNRKVVINLPACFHRFHSDCLRPWLTTNAHCPYCRTQVLHF